MPATKTAKPKKPYKDFPLFAHQNGQWCKKIRGKLHYFGPWADPDAALAEYLRVRDDLQAGRTPSSFGQMTLADMVNHFLDDAEERRDNGKLSPLSYRDYKWTGEQMLAHFGRNVDPTQIRKSEFSAFRRKIEGKYAPSRMTKTITVCKMMFTWAHDEEIIETLPRWGKKFKGASKTDVRKAKVEAGGKDFGQDELRRLIEAADPQMKAMILLGLNCGLGNTDIATLTESHIEDGWIDFARRKTGIERKAPLWPETIAAIEAMPRYKNEELADRLFLTRSGAEVIVVNDEGGRNDKITIRFVNLMKKCKCYRKGRGFYGLRHTFQTVGDGAGDPVATSYIMGHADDSMAAVYREKIFASRLENVTGYVREWLFPVKGDEEE